MECFLDWIVTSGARVLVGNVLVCVGLKKSSKVFSARLCLLLHQYYQHAVEVLIWEDSASFAGGVTGGTGLLAVEALIYADFTKRVATGC